MLEQLGKNAKEASRILMTASTTQKDAALSAIAAAFQKNKAYILEENRKDLEAAEANGMSRAMLDRLALNDVRVQGLSDAAADVMALADPIGKLRGGTTRPNGLIIEKVSVPLGVVAVIYEARPNVTAEAATLCLKSGNCVILRGGKEALRSNRAIAETMRKAIASVGLPRDCVQLVEDTSRDSANALMTLTDYVDVLIPRGGAGLIRACVEHAQVPLIETGTGNCHVYVDKDADLDMAQRIIYNAKVSRPSVCNACESLVIHRAVAEKAIPMIAQSLEGAGVLIHGDETVCALLPSAVPATEEDYGKEYLGYEISVRVVDSIDEAIAHIRRYTTGHSECIVTNSLPASQQFTAQVDAAAVYVNASTRFTDGGCFGFGAEIGISTQKLHARGPLGLEQLTSEKYIVRGSGQIR
ncbi:MAG: glutamate-5-semialdehyde dehydrogenase [Clostridia bacterium]|nr:glutamate-5-semialdehyde dehydrogenase [Clostridia bacterium]MBQ6092600.1 glutamate-5-semialdehyde dehydrogenase [Clostridia bacterium]